jgi:hypothetical protein
VDLKGEKMKVYEQNSKLRYKIVKLEDQILMLQESLGSSDKSYVQK